jgi:hypothetical protein
VLLLNGDGPELSHGGQVGWRSPAYGLKEPAPLVVSCRRGYASVQFGAVLAFSALSSEGELVVKRLRDEVEMILSSPWNRTVAFPPSGMPRLRAT